MKLLITGANGQLGTELRRCLKRGRSELGPLPEKLLHAMVIGTDVAGQGVEALDITDRHEVAVFLRRHQPDVVINCGAFTNVDGCETQREAAFKLNALGPRNLALACAEIGAKLVHVSTDYVFRGEGDRPFCEYDAPDPQSMYGRTKLLGEQYVREFCPKYFIVRTAWLYGYAGKNFVKTMVRLAKEKGGATVVDDQLGNPTNAADLAHHLLKLCVTKEYGVYHCTGEGVCSWYEFAAEIARLAGKEGVMAPCTSEAYAAAHPESAKRPAYSALENAMLAATVGNEMRGWKEALGCFFENWDGE
ncbi:MAG: dTDP-4-dehydrorhamnose reductase [Oscillospiraceae bacterium]|nr:dTDP-4-dehydrorhamnose reductase [Oscillospiraceae bacterium]